MRGITQLMIGLTASAGWLVLLEVSAFNIVIVSLGVLAALTLNPKTRGAHR
jgi:hypothetical protein